jgi:glycine betaine/choline ABC-type transport system substrate-binding protein
MKRKMYGGGIEDDIGKLYSLKAQITYFKNSIKEDEKRRRTNHTLNTLRKDDIESLTTEFYKLFNKIKSKISKDHLSKLELN